MPISLALRRIRWTVAAAMFNALATARPDSLDSTMAWRVIGSTRRGACLIRGRGRRGIVGWEFLVLVSDYGIVNFSNAVFYVL